MPAGTDAEDPADDGFLDALFSDIETHGLREPDGDREDAEV